MSTKRLNDSDISAIVSELERWRDGQLGSKLTWAKLESSYGYTRQALQSHLRIKVAYRTAKIALREGLVKTRTEYSEEIDLLKARVLTLQSTLDEYKSREQEWQKRWQRIAYHLRFKGFSVAEVDTPITAIPNKKDTDKVLRPFDRPMLPTGRK